MKIVTIVGARPQFVKAAVVSRALADRSGVQEIIVHTGQHYDANMSAVFFNELSIPEPQHHLGIGGGLHGAMTGRQLEAIEQVLVRSEEHTSELQSLMRISYAVFCLKKKKKKQNSRNYKRLQ